MYECERERERIRERQKVCVGVKERVFATMIVP